MICMSSATFQQFSTRYFFDFTRLGDEDEGAAETGVTETTLVPTIYPHPTNEKIKFWDLPGIGMFVM